MQPVNVTADGTKILEGRQWPNFTLEQKTGDDAWTTFGTKSVAYDAQNAAFDQFDFSDLVRGLTFDKVGTYSFRMTEAAGDLENTASGEKLTLESNADGKAIFTLPFTAADIGKTYTYKLSETNEGVAGMTYDTQSL